MVVLITLGTALLVVFRILISTIGLILFNTNRVYVTNSDILPILMPEIVTVRNVFSSINNYRDYKKLRDYFMFVNIYKIYFFVILGLWIVNIVVEMV